MIAPLVRLSHRDDRKEGFFFLLVSCKGVNGKEDDLDPIYLNIIIK